MRVGRCSAEFHTLGVRGSTPGPAIRREGECSDMTARYANWHSGQLERLMPVGSTPTRATWCGKQDSVPWSNGNDTSLTKRKRGFDSLRDDFDEEWAAGPTERRLACNQEIGVRLPGGPLFGSLIGLGR
jgi:hypothetical protein